MRNAVAPDLPFDLRPVLAAQGVPLPARPWMALAGGRTNRVWQVGAGAGALVVKLYDTAAQSPLFPNLPGAEAAALRALAGQGIAPELVAAFDTPFGPCLVYAHVPGARWSAGTAEVAQLLMRLHALPAPKGLRGLDSGSAALVAQTHAILRACSGKIADDLRALQPEAQVPPAQQLCFLHGDAVPGNLLTTATGPVLIDWQCPARGDACEDMALFLSPAMQALYRGAPLDAAEIEVFLAAFPPPLVARYNALRRHFHWRMAAHCLWKATRGEKAYTRGLGLELAALER